MTRTKIYDLVKQLLIDIPELRDNDKKLMLAVWEKETGGQIIIPHNFLRLCTTPETITRTRRMIQKINPDLRSTQPVFLQRKEIQEQKGTHIFRQETIIYQNNKLFN